MSYIEKIGVSNALNSILVNEGIRPAMLVQPNDYNEATGSDPTTKDIVQTIQATFPEFIIHEDYDIYQGVIMTKNNDYKKLQHISLEKMGEILGYPCYKDFELVDRNQIHSTFHLYVKEKNQTETIIYANVCNDNSKMSFFQDIANNSKKVFQSKNYKKLLGDFEIEDVFVVHEESTPTRSLIDKLIDNTTLDDHEINEILNIFYNFGFSESLENYFQNNFQYYNPIHKGILLSLLVNEKNDILSPFCPIQRFPREQEQHDNIVNSWEKDIIDLLERTKIPTSLSNGSGSKKRRKKSIKGKTKKVKPYA